MKTTTQKCVFGWRVGHWMIWNAIQINELTQRINSFRNSMNCARFTIRLVIHWIGLNSNELEPIHNFLWSPTEGGTITLTEQLWKHSFPKQTRWNMPRRSMPWLQVRRRCRDASRTVSSWPRLSLVQPPTLLVTVRALWAQLRSETWPILATVTCSWFVLGKRQAQHQKRHSSVWVAITDTTVIARSYRDATKRHQKKIQVWDRIIAISIQNP